MQVPSFILKHSNIKDSKMWQFYLLLAGWASIYTVMNVSIILFLNEVLGSIFLAGLALSIGSVFSMLFDGLFSSIQKVFSARTMFMWSILGMIIAVLFFILSSHPVIAFLAAIFFRISFDLCDITAVSYVLAKSLPAEYGQNLSYKQLAQGVGMIAGFIISAILLQASYFIGGATASVIDTAASLVSIKAQAENFISTLFMMKVFLLILLLVLWFLAFILFDKEVKDFSKETIMSSLQRLESDTLDGLKHTAIQVTKNIPHFKKDEKNQIELDTTENKKKMTMKEIFEELTSSIKDMALVFKKQPINLSLVWSMTIMGIFSYWDTFLGTFLPIFFTEVLRSQSGWIQNLPGSLLMLFFIFPVLGFLPVVAKYGDKYGRHYFMILGIAITAIATLVIGMVSMKSFFIILIAGFGISFGYLFGMSTAKAQTASKLNEFLAVEKQMDKIDTNASAGPIMLVDNFGNIIGPLFGGAMISIFGFQGFFIVFSLFLMALLAYTFKKYSKISGHSYIFQSPIIKGFEIQKPVKEVEV